VCAGLAFYAVDALQRDMLRAEENRERKRHILSNASAAPTTARGMSYTLQTLQSVTVIVFTNSLVTFGMEMMSPSSAASKSKSVAGIASSLGTVVAGLIVAKTIIQVVEGCAGAKYRKN